MRVCDQLKRLRCSLNLSQERFGSKVGISGKSVSAYETGRSMPTVKLLSQIANTYNVSFAEISNSDRTCLHQRIQELEKSFTLLKHELENILSTEALVENRKESQSD